MPPCLKLGNSNKSYPMHPQHAYYYWLRVGYKKFLSPDTKYITSPFLFPPTILTTKVLYSCAKPPTINTLNFRSPLKTSNGTQDLLYTIVLIVWSSYPGKFAQPAETSRTASSPKILLTNTAYGLTQYSFPDTLALVFGECSNVYYQVT